MPQNDFTGSIGFVPVEWSPETGYPQNIPEKVTPRITLGNGLKRGLKLILNAQLDEYYCSSANGAGFKTILHNPIDTPYIKETGIPIILGFESNFRIKTIENEASIDLRQMGQMERACAFNNEINLTYFRHYTARNCEMECDAVFILKRCGCIPSYLPLIFQNASECHINEFNCLYIYENQFNSGENAVCRSKCLPACNDLAYYPEVFYMPFSENSFGLEVCINVKF